MGKIIAGIIAAVAIIGVIYFVDVDQTQEAQLPDVDVDVSGGQLPSFKAETGDIDVGTTTIEVPTIDLESPEEERRDEGRLANN